jgi:hypothetical protein
MIMAFGKMSFEKTALELKALEEKYQFCKKITKI